MSLKNHAEKPPKTHLSRKTAWKKYLIPAFFLAAAVPCAVAEEAQEDLKILLEFAPDAVTKDEPFTLNILVNHPVPDEIAVETPDFHDEFRVDRLRVETRIILNNPREGDRWTVFEYLLTAVETGLLTLDPFQVSVFDETRTTNPISVLAREKQQSVQTALLWFGENGYSRVYPVRIGDSREITLRVTDWDRNKDYPAIPPWIESPPNAIIEPLPLSKNDRGAGVILRLRVIPLDENPVNIEGQTFYHERMPLEIPSLRINTLPAALSGAAAENSEPPSDEAEAGVGNPSEPADFTVQPHGEVRSFPVRTDSGKDVFITARGAGVLDCLNRAAALWEDGRYAAALAALRRGERELTAAYVVKAARITCENALRLPLCPNEPWRPARPLLFIFIFSTLLFILLFFTKTRRTLLRAALLCASLSALSALLFSHAEAGNRAVLRQCAAYPIPEEDVEPNAFFMEGEPARVISKSGAWVYAESLIQNAPQKSGWVKKEDMEFY